MVDATQLDALTNTVPILGITLLACMVVAKLVKIIGIPKVSGYIIIGIILGPSFLNYLSSSFVESFQFFNELALGLILFNIGGEFNRQLIGKMKREQILYSLLAVPLIYVSIFVLIFSFSYFVPDFTLVEKFVISMFLALVAIEAAPPTTLLVLKEYNTKGELSQSIKVYLGYATLVAVIGTMILTKVLEYIGFWQVQNSGSTILFFQGAWNIIGSLIFGVLIGVSLSYFERFEKKIGNTLFTVITAILLGQSLAHYLGLDSLLISLFLGFTLANASNVGEKIHQNIKDMGGSIYALFFVLAGTHVDFLNFVENVGVFGAIYIGARTVGILVSSRVASKFLNIKDKGVRRYHGLGVLSHAGAALAIVARVNQHEEHSAKIIFNIVVASIFVFELLGPLMLKYALYKSGEITSWSPSKDKTSKSKNSISEILQTFLNNITPNTKKIIQDGELDEFLNTDIVAIESDANLDNIKVFLDEDHEIFPVVDHAHSFLGALDLDAVKKALYQNRDKNFITASHVIGDSTFIPSNCSLIQARDIFFMTQKSVLPVVNPVDRRLEGLIKQKDVVLAIDERKNILEKI